MNVKYSQTKEVLTWKNLVGVEQGDLFCKPQQIFHE
jgi:hypothetical protein